MQYEAKSVEYRLFTLYIYTQWGAGDRGGTVNKVLCYKSEGRCFDPS